MRTVIIVVLLCASAPTRASGQSVPTLWKARALEAADKIEGLGKRVGGKAGPDVARCETMLEMAYGQHLVNPDIVVKSTDSVMSYHLILSGGDAGMFDLVYNYDHTGQLLGTAVHSLPKGWKIVQVLAEPRAFGLMAGPCSFVFHYGAPFAAGAQTSG
jgi:hypothetical protein